MERDYTVFIPEYIAAGMAILAIAIELAFPNLRKDVVAYVTAAGAAAYGGAALFWIGADPVGYQGLFVADDFTMYFRVLAAAVVIVVALMSATHMRDKAEEAGEYYGLLLTAALGTGLMAGARELITAYLALELLSFSLYILVGFLKRDRRSNEASTKYILLGGFSSALLLYGFSLIYGLTGTTYYAGIAEELGARATDTDLMALMAYVLIIAGVGFKVSAVPFHAWAPDAYEGAPLPITAFLSTLSKAAGFALILRLFSNALLIDAEMWRWAIVLIAALTMVYGNLVAIQQTNVKRLVAYSSIGQVGYMLMAIAVLGYGDEGIVREASAALLLHLGGYVATTLLLFVAVIAYYDKTGDETIPGMRGLAETQPLLALAITVALFSFSGLPFFVGFTTKFFLFQASTADELIWLVGLAATMSFVSLYYYLMIIRQMYLFDPAPGLTRFRPSAIMTGLAGILLIAVVVGGVWPTPLFQGADEAAKELELTATSGPNSLVLESE